MKAQRATPTPVLRAASAACFGLIRGLLLRFLRLVEDVGDAFLCVRLSQPRAARDQLGQIGLVRGGKIAVQERARQDPPGLRCRGGLIPLSRVIGAQKHIGEIACRIADRRRCPAGRLPCRRAEGFGGCARDVRGSAGRRTCRPGEERGADHRSHRPNQEPMRRVAKDRPHRYARAPNGSAIAQRDNRRRPMRRVPPR